MARFLLSALLLQVGLLVLLSSRSAEGLSLEDRVQQLAENYIKDALAAKNAQFEALERKVQQQEFKLIRLEALELEMVQIKATVQQQKSLLVALQDKIKTIPKLIPSGLETKEQSSIGKSIMLPRTCREVRAADPSLSSGMHWIDPDGQGAGDDPIYVYCDMTKGSTSILHDSESPTDVGHCTDPGCYSRAINYNATMRQMNALAELSSECHQSIQYDCNYAPFQFGSVTYSWWNDRNGKSQTFWAGRNASVHTCQCGIDHNCAEATRTCNCDSAAPVPLTDSGIITDKDYLPITRLSFGRTQLASSSGVHTLGRFECSGQVAVSGMPKSCADLWQIGHSLSGLYSVMGQKQVESVYCDFAKLPADSGFQTWIGFVDVKSSPVYFYVQRETSFDEDGIIPFEIEKLNVGGAMNMATGIFTAPRPGIYFFSFTAVYNSRIKMGTTNGDIGIAGFDDGEIQSTIYMKTGEQVWMNQDTEGGTGYLYDSSSRMTDFTGWLLQEDFPYN